MPWLPKSRLFWRDRPHRELATHNRRSETVATLLAVIGLGGILAWSLHQRSGLTWEEWLNSFLSRDKEAEKLPLPRPVPTHSPLAQAPTPQSVPTPLELLPVPAELPPVLPPPPPAAPNQPRTKPAPQRLPQSASPPAQVPAPNSISSKLPQRLPQSASPPAQPAPTQSSQRFVDVPADHWATTYISTLAERNIIAGFQDGAFQPDRAISRAEFAVLLDRVVDWPPRRDRGDFRDVPTQHWAYGAIQTAYTRGFMNGYPQQRFLPTQAISRLEAVMAIANGLDLPVPAKPHHWIKRYRDWQSIPPYARQKVAAAIATNLLNNTPEANQLQPDRPMTRADAAALLYTVLTRTQDHKSTQDHKK